MKNAKKGVSDGKTEKNNNMSAKEDKSIEVVSDEWASNEMIEQVKGRKGNTMMRVVLDGNEFEIKSLTTQLPNDTRNN
jgi:cupin superfamily acireductone dioxygenase involved in methionine salvage